MEKLFILLLFYFSITFSIIGYGNIFSLISNRKYSIGEKGLNGILFLIIISYLTNFFSPHSLSHNLFIISIGLLSFFYYLSQNFRNNLKELKIVFIIFLILFIGLLMHKNHDDFYYYHFSYTLSLIEYKKILGLGLLNHGFRTPSSIFYLNSLFYLPYIKYFMINSGAIFIMGFVNIIFLDKINNLLKTKKTSLILFLLILSFIYINTAFYRLAEHGTDRSALILIFLLVITYMESIRTLKKVFNAGKLVNYYEKIIILLLLIISLKSFYLIYLSLFLMWLYQLRFFVFKRQIISIFSNNIFTYIFIVGLSLSVLHVFLNTGCLVYPASFTCFDNFQWAIPEEQVQQMKSWYSLWSKAGASPTFRIEDPELYLANFNWVYHWVKIYFFTKVTDTIFVIFLISIICLFTLKNIKNKSYIGYNHNYNPLFAILIILFLEWFINHPALRYGGYTLLALMFFIPLSIFLKTKVLFDNKFKKKVIILIVIALSFFVIKNISRLNKEHTKYRYNILINPYFYINENSFYFQKILADLQHKYKKNTDSFYLILNYDLINNDN
tara:strand:- start:990 stop:2654 length:1665 start_codon:yes stop_codon:yes gene_type:complete